MMKRTAVCYVTLMLACASCSQTEKASLSGTYTSKEFSLIFEKGRCYCIDGPSTDRLETEYLIRKDRLYIAPIVPKGQTMTRNVWVVYTIKDGSLESSHVEDMDTGDVFYKDKTPKIVLTRQ